MINGTNTSSCLSKAVKHGIGRLTASADILSLKHKTNPITRLTRVSHKAPTRLIPVGKTSIRNAGAAVVALSNYGAGMLQGDSAEVSVNVEAYAKLGLVTQGAARIYTQRVPSVCEAHLHAKVEKNGILVFAPDPCALFASSSYSQTQEFEIDPKSSVALIDWFSSGRFENKERWMFDTFKTKTKLFWSVEKSIDKIPFLLDSTSIDLFNQAGNHDANAVGDFNCFASLILYGERIQSIRDRCQNLSDTIAAKHTRIRERDLYTRKDGTNAIISDNLAKRVIMGFSKVLLPGKPSDAYVVRLAAKTNNDIYRIFNHCLIPIAPDFGIEFYKDRILAQRSEIPQKKKSHVSIEEVSKFNKNIISKQISVSSLNSVMRSKDTISSFWAIAMLSDSGLPTGSFAHSAGLEAAAQIGIINDEEDLLNYIQAAISSSMSLLAPFLISARRIVNLDKAINTDKKSINLLNSWDKLNRECNAVMVTNEPAWSASIDQGKSLARVASHWLDQKFSHSGFLDCLKKKNDPHIATTLGVIGGLLDLDEIQICRLFAYCMARDIVSSAVRLSLVGPLASVPLLHTVQESAENCILAAQTAIQKHPEDPLLVAAASAPVIEAIHPCHEILQVRLFRS